MERAEISDGSRTMGDLGRTTNCVTVFTFTSNFT